jgi:hypothetical protein
MGRGERGGAEREPWDTRRRGVWWAIETRRGVVEKGRRYKLRLGIGSKTNSLSDSTHSSNHQDPLFPSPHPRPVSEMALPTVPPAASTRTKHASNSSLGSSFNPNYPPPAPSSTSNTAPSPSSNRPYSSSSASSSASSAVGPNPSSGNSYLNPQTSSGYAPVPTGQSASRLNPNWAAGPGPKRASSSTMGGGSGSSGSREGSDEIEMDETPPRTVAAGVGAVGGRGEVVEGVLSSRLGVRLLPPLLAL